MPLLSRWWFAAAGCVLVLLASGLVIAGLYQVGASLIGAHGLLAQRLLTAVGYVVIAVAVFDVAKYILEEEVIRERELRHVGEVRRSLTRFTATVLIAVFLEGIVLTFKVAEDDISLTLYPVLLIFAGVGMLVGLGLFQRIAIDVEQAAHDSDRRDAEREKDG
ncbi:MAG TPA: GNAT family acetyltransferase [Hyphomicrobiaceae bacterium]